MRTMSKRVKSTLFLTTLTTVLMAAMLRQSASIGVTAVYVVTVFIIGRVWYLLGQLETHERFGRAIEDAGRIARRYQQNNGRQN